MNIKSDDISKLHDLFSELYDKYSRLQNKKYLYKDIEDLTVIEINTILVIHRGEKIKTMSQIAKILGVSYGTPTITIDRLIKKGYVKRWRDEEDRRQVFVALSEKGEEVYNSIVSIKDKIMRVLFESIEADKRKEFIDLFILLNEKFDEVFSKLF